MLIGICLLLATLAVAQQDAHPVARPEPKFTFKVDVDGCGDQSYESQTYDFRKGKIVRILSANKVFFDQTSVNGQGVKDRFTVRLVGISANQNQAIVKKTLQDMLLNREVEIFGSLGKETDKEFGGIVWLFGDDEDIDEVNIYLLEKGVEDMSPLNPPIWFQWCGRVVWKRQNQEREKQK